MKFHLEHQWGGGKATVGFGPDRIRTLIFMATGYNGENLVTTLAPSFLIGSSLFFQVMRIGWIRNSKFGKIRP